MLDIFGKEGEKLQKIVAQQQKEIDSLNEELADFKKIFNELKKKHAELAGTNNTNYEAYKKLEAAFDKAKQELQENKEALSQSQLANKDLQKENKKNYDAFLKMQDLRDKRDSQIKKDKLALEKFTAENKTLQKENKTNYEAFLKMQESRDKRDAELKELKVVFDTNLAELKKIRKENNDNYEEYKKISALHEYAKKKIADQAQEQEMFVLQVAQAKDELGKKTLELQKLSTLNQSLSGKLSRLLEKSDGAVDYGTIEMMQIDSVSEIPQIIWKITDYSRGHQAVPDFYFRTTLQDGLAGIGLLENPKELETQMAEPILIPSLIGNNATQTDHFKGLSQQHWAQMVAASFVLEQLILSKGKNVQNNEDFDYSFWQNSFVSLVTAIKRLPVIMRYSKVKLKRELQNPDYEHLWLEFYDVDYGQFKLPKFEMRIGAAVIEPAGFSKFPKLEFPLIDSRIKPFDSWFPESVDDFGQKFELRFSIEKRSMDINNFFKLSDPDQRFIQALIFILPSAINQLIRSKISIHRQWTSWSSFVNDLGVIYQSQITALKPDLLAAKVVDPSAVAGKESSIAPASNTARSAAPTSAPTASPKSDTSTTEQALPTKSKRMSVVVSKKTSAKVESSNTAGSNKLSTKTKNKH